MIDFRANIDHEDFGGRAELGADCTSGVCVVGEKFTDENSHGSHVAGIIIEVRQISVLREP